MTTLRAPAPALRRAPRRELPPGVLHAGVAIGASALVGLLVAASGWKMAIGALLFVLICAIGCLRPAVFLLLFIVVRPWLDSWGLHEVGGVKGADPGGIFAAVSVAVLIMVVASTRRAALPRGSAQWALVVAVTFGSAIYALVNLRGTIGVEPIAELIRIAAMAAIFILAAHFFGTPKGVHLVWLLIALGALWPAFDGIKEWIHGVAPAQGSLIGRPTSTFAGPNAFGAYLAVAGLLFMCAPLDLPKKVRIPALVLILVALVGTYSREGWVMFLLGAMLLEARRRPALVAGLAIAVVTVTLAVPSVHDRVLPSNKQPTRAQIANGVSTRASDSYTWRINTWRALLDKYASSPVVGYGLRSTPYLNPRRAGRTAGDGFAAHNTVVKMLFEGGIALLVAWVLLFLALMRTAWDASRRAWALQRYGQVMFVLWITVVVVAVGTDDPTASSAMMYALLALAGSLTGAWWRDKKDLPSPAR